jgi:hypothetical protein
VEAQQVAQVGEGVAGVGGITAHERRPPLTAHERPREQT